MKKMMLVALVLCLCFAVFGGSAFAEAAATEKPAAELYQAGLEALDAEDYGKALEYYQQAAEAGYTPDEEEQEILKAVLGNEYQQK